MSNTNLKGETKRVIKCTLFTQPPVIDKRTKPGETIGDSGKHSLKLVEGNEPMQLSANSFEMNEKGQRSNGRSREDMEGFNGKKERKNKFAPYQRIERQERLGQANNEIDR